jgi:uncharacterized protein YjbI with pentapeptide repeats
VLAGATADGADFTGAKLRQVVLDFGFFRGASFAGADLSLASLAGANLTGADLTGATLIGTNVVSAKLIDLKGVDDDTFAATRNLARAVRQ